MTRIVCFGAALLASLSVTSWTALATEPRAGGPSKSGDARPPEEMVQVWAPEVGMVRGTRDAVAAWGTRLKADPGPNHTVEACRVMVWNEAEKLGARTIEAVSAGPHRRTPKGEWVAPVRMRVTYARPDGLEVKEATMTCIVDRENKIVEAFT